VDAEAVGQRCAVPALRYRGRAGGGAAGGEEGGFGKGALADVALALFLHGAAVGGGGGEGSGRIAGGNAVLSGIRYERKARDVTSRFDEWAGEG